MKKENGAILILMLILMLMCTIISLTIFTYNAAKTAEPYYSEDDEILDEEFDYYDALEEEMKGSDISGFSSDY